MKILMHKIKIKIKTVSNRIKQTKFYYSVPYVKFFH